MPTAAANPRAALYTSATPEWYTPDWLLAEVARFLGSIDLDPCPAPVDGLARVDGLTIPWHGRIFCNPPYGRHIGRWTAKALTEPVSELVLLVPARTDTGWFAPLFAYPICFLRGRLHFSGAYFNAPFPSALVYRGRRRLAFARRFGAFGSVMVPATVPAPAGPSRRAPRQLALL